jgi:hypothetical protein
MKDVFGVHLIWMIGKKNNKIIKSWLQIRRTALRHVGSILKENTEVPSVM